MKPVDLLRSPRYRSLRWVFAGILVAAVGVFLLWIFLPQKPKVLRVGFIGTLTGPQSDLGVQGRNGALLAADEINARGGINGARLELVFRDDHNDSVRARRAAAELAAEGLPVIISHQTSALAAESLAGIAGSGSIIVSATASSELFAGKDDQFIRITAGNILMMDPLRDHLFAGGSHRRVSAYYDPRNASYALDMINRLKNTVPEGCTLDLAVQRVRPGGTAFGTAAHALRVGNPDAAVVIYGPFDAALFAQVARKHGFRGELLSPAWAMTNELIRVGGKAVDGMLFGHFVIMNPMPESLVPIAREFRKRYGVEPSYVAFYGYDAVLMLDQALSATDRLTRLSGSRVKQVILRHRHYRSPLGDYTVDAYGDSLRPAHLSRVHNGVFELIR